MFLKEKSEIIDLILPNLELFQFGNIYSGSYKSFNFKVIPDVGRLLMNVFVWSGVNCLEETRSEFVRKKEFSLNDQGYSAAQKWILNEFEKLKIEKN